MIIRNLSRPKTVEFLFCWTFGGPKICQPNKGCQQNLWFVNERNSFEDFRKFEVRILLIKKLSKNDENVERAKNEREKI